MLLIRIAGWAFLVATAWQGLRMSSLDREMQHYRVPHASLAAYFFVPLRWRKELYTEEGHHLVAEAWWAMLRMYGFALLGGILMAIGSAGG